MKPGGRGRRRTRPARIDCLVALAVGQRTMNIGGQRHAAKLPDGGGHVSIRGGEVYNPLTRRRPTKHFRLKPALTKDDLEPISYTAARTHQSLPAVWPIIPPYGQEQQLYPSSGAGLYPLEPSGQHPALIGDQKITGSEVLSYVAEDPIFQSAGLPVENQQPRAVSRLQRNLGDTLFRQIIIEVCDIHT